MRLSYLCSGLLISASMVGLAQAEVILIKDATAGNTSSSAIRAYTYSIAATGTGTWWSGLYNENLRAAGDEGTGELGVAPGDCYRGSYKVTLPSTLGTLSDATFSFTFQNSIGTPWANPSAQVFISDNAGTTAAEEFVTSGFTVADVMQKTGMANNTTLNIAGTDLVNLLNDSYAATPSGVRYLTVRFDMDPRNDGGATLGADILYTYTSSADNADHRPSLSMTVVPEPTTLALMAGVAGLGLRRRRR